MNGSVGQGDSNLLNIAATGDSFELETIYKNFVKNQSITVKGKAESITAKIRANKSDPLPTATGGLKLNVSEGKIEGVNIFGETLSGIGICLLYTSPSPRDATLSRMPSSA